MSGLSFLLSSRMGCLSRDWTQIYLAAEARRLARPETSTNDLLAKNEENLAMIVSDEEMEEMTGPVMAQRSNATAKRQPVNRTAFVQLPLR